MLTDGTVQTVERLARYHGTEFRPVRPGELDARVVHVFAHGWQPGYRLRERLLATADRVTALPVWDPRLVDAAGRPLISDYLALLDALVALGPEHAVLWYSWLDEAATDADVFQAFRSRQATQINGRRLAVALQRVLDRPMDGDQPVRLHLIGHSHGSAVVTHAAVSLERPPEQVTLLDSPEDPISRVGGASDQIDLVLSRLRPGRASGTTFVDSYASAFGRPYHRRPGLSAVVDVQLTAPLALVRDPVRAINAIHLYPVQWYARSVSEAGRGVGYGWSPLAGADPSRLESWYQVPLPQRPLALRRHVGDRLGYLTERFSRPAQAQVRPVEGVRLALDGDSAAASIVVSEPGDELVEFDLQLRGCTGQESVELDLDGTPAFTMSALHPVPQSGRYLMLTDGRPGEHLVSARLRGAGERAAVDVVDLRMVSGSRPSRAFTLGRSAAAVFLAGAVTGGLGVLITVIASGLTARKVWSVLRRRRPRPS